EGQLKQQSAAHRLD
ncbi:hypothetical protein, partial [Klebsiella pneumoniae]